MVISIHIYVPVWTEYIQVSSQILESLRVYIIVLKVRYVEVL